MPPPCLRPRRRGGHAEEGATPGHVPSKRPAAPSARRVPPSSTKRRMGVPVAVRECRQLRRGENTLPGKPPPRPGAPPAKREGRRESSSPPVPVRREAGPLLRLLAVVVAEDAGRMDGGHRVVDGHPVVEGFRLHQQPADPLEAQRLEGLAEVAAQAQVMSGFTIDGLQNSCGCRTPCRRPSTASVLHRGTAARPSSRSRSRCGRPALRTSGGCPTGSRRIARKSSITPSSRCQSQPFLVTWVPEGNSGRPGSPRGRRREPSGTPGRTTSCRCGGPPRGVAALTCRP